MIYRNQADIWLNSLLFSRIYTDLFILNGLSTTNGYLVCAVGSRCLFVFSGFGDGAIFS
jgi:hypothetical protein